MAQLSATAYKALYGTTGTVFPDNTTAEISEGDMRTFGENTADSFYNKSDNPEIATGVITREFNRAFSAELLFDKNEIDYAIHTLDDDVEYTVAASGHLLNQFSTAIQTIITDGTRAITFTGFNFIYGITNGEIKEAGTYQIFFMYRNGVASVHWAEPSMEEANLVPLDAPSDFAAVADGVDEIDLSWTDSADAESFEIEYSETGGDGPWIELTDPATGVEAYAHTGLDSNTTYHYRIRAIASGFANSQWVVVAATTENAGDVTPPVPTFDPADTDTDFPVNKPIIINWNEPTRNTNESEITNANIAALITLKETDGSGANIPFTATINTEKTQWRIVPTTIYGANQLVYLALAAVEDVNGAETSGHTITFTTGEMTFFDGSSNMLLSGNVLNDLFTDPDTNFELEITLGSPSLSGVQRIISKQNAGLAVGKTFSLYTNGTDINFQYILKPESDTSQRVIRWAGALTSGEHKYVLKYDGSIDTNNGLDRCILEIDDVVTGSKTLAESLGTLDSDLHDTGVPIAVGNIVNGSGNPASTQWFSGLAKDFIIRSNSGGTVELNIPILATGEDVSGNNLDGTWV